MKTNISLAIDGNNLTLEELESLAEDIRMVMTNGKGITIQQYIQRAETITEIELGTKLMESIRCENKLEAYFPDEVFKILTERFCRRDKI